MYLFLSGFLFLFLFVNLLLLFIIIILNSLGGGDPKVQIYPWLAHHKKN